MRQQFVVGRLTLKHGVNDNDEDKLGFGKYVDCEPRSTSANCLGELELCAVDIWTRLSHLLSSHPVCRSLRQSGRNLNVFERKWSWRENGDSREERGCVQHCKCLC